MLGENCVVVDLIMLAFALLNPSLINIHIRRRLLEALARRRASSTLQRHLEAFVGRPNLWCNVAKAVSKLLDLQLKLT